MRLTLLALIVSFHVYSYQQFYDEDVYGQTLEDSFNYMDDNDFGQGVYCPPDVRGEEPFTTEPNEEDDVRANDPMDSPRDFTETPLEESTIQTD